MTLLRRIGCRLLDVTAAMAYLLTGLVVSTVSFGWLLKQMACNSDGTIFWSLTMLVGVSPLLYVGWLIWFLLLCSLDVQIHALCMGIRKPTRASTADGFNSWFILNVQLLMYLRARFVKSLPLVEAFLPIHGLRHLVLLSYSDSTHLGYGSMILGNLFDPDLTKVGDNAIIGGGSAVIAHSLTINLDGSRLLVTAPVTIGARSVIGGAAQIHPGVQIGDDAIIEPASYVAAFTQIGDGEVWGGNPARFIRMRNALISSTVGLAQHRNLDVVLDDASEVTLRQIVARVLDRPVESVTPTLSTQDTAAWDSLAQLAMALELQNRFGVTLTNQESFRLHSMASLRDAVSRTQTGIVAIDAKSIESRNPPS